VLDITEFVLYHEIGHALVHAYDLPILGKQEDAADALAMVISIALLEEPEIALAAAEVFELSVLANSQIGIDNFWDSHSIDGKRMASLLCWVYGSDPERFASFIESGYMPADRAEYCKNDYQSKVRDWMDVLDPYFKE